MKAKKAKKLQNAAGFAAGKICLNLIRKLTVFGNLWEDPTWQPRQAKNERKSAQKANMKETDGPKAQNPEK